MNTLLQFKQKISSFLARAVIGGELTNVGSLSPANQIFGFIFI